MFPLRSITMTAIGLLTAAIGVGAWVSPDIQSNYSNGWLYLHFGLAGIVSVLIFFGVVLTVWGALGIRRALRTRRGGKVDLTK